MCIYQNWFIHFMSIFCCFYLLIIVNNTTYFLDYFTYILMSGTAESWLILFNPVKNHSTVFCSDCTILYSTSNGVAFQLHIFTDAFWNIAVLTGVRWHLVVVLACNSLMTNDREHLFKCLLAICVSSLEKCQVFWPWWSLKRIQLGQRESWLGSWKS